MGERITEVSSEQLHDLMDGGKVVDNIGLLGNLVCIEDEGCFGHLPVPSATSDGVYSVFDTFPLGGRELGLPEYVSRNCPVFNKCDDCPKNKR